MARLARASSTLAALETRGVLLALARHRASTGDVPERPDTAHDRAERIADSVRPAFEKDVPRMHQLELGRLNLLGTVVEALHVALERLGVAE